MIPLNKRIIFALDFDSVKAAKMWVLTLREHIKFYKVGYQLFLKGGLEFVEWLKNQGVDVMLDLKLFDIPRTVNAALNQVKDYADYITVHSRDVILKEIPDDIKSKILGVTVLTCFDDEDMIEECNCTVEYLVLRRITSIVSNKCGGFVMSGRELDFLKYNFTGIDYKVIIPGVKIDKPRDDDQKRVVTIEEAFKNGADHVVIGRPIYQSNNMIETVELAQNKIRNTIRRIQS